MNDVKWYAATLLCGGLYACIIVPFAAPERMLILAALGIFSLTGGILLWRGNPVGKAMGIIVMILIALWGIVTWGLLDNRPLGLLLMLIGWLSAYRYHRIDLSGEYRGR